MQKTLLFHLLTLICLLTTSCSSISKSNKTPEELAQTIFESLKKGDKEAFYNYYANLDDVHSFIQKEGSSPKEQASEKKFAKERFESFDMKIKAMFDDIRSEGKEIGILDWSQVEFVLVKQRLYGNGNHIGRLTIVFKNNNNLFYSIEMPAILDTDRGWLMHPYHTNSGPDLNGPVSTIEYLG